MMADVAAFTTAGMIAASPAAPTTLPDAQFFDVQLTGVLDDLNPIGVFPMDECGLV